MPFEEGSHAPDFVIVRNEPEAGCVLVTMHMTSGQVLTRLLKGGIVVQCVEGWVAYKVFGKTLTLAAGKLLYMPMGEPHSVKSIEDALLLLTVFLPKP